MGSATNAAGDEECSCPTEKSQQVADNINKSGGKAISVPGDILNDDYINDLVKKSAEFGNGKIHYIVVCGIVKHVLCNADAYRTTPALHGYVPLQCWLSINHASSQDGTVGPSTPLC